MEQLDNLASKLPVIDFYDTTFPTSQMKFTISKVYAEVMGFLDNALSYYRGGRLGSCSLFLCEFSRLQTDPKTQQSSLMHSSERSQSLKSPLPRSRKR